MFGIGQKLSYTPARLGLTEEILPGDVLIEEQT